MPRSLRLKGAGKERISVPWLDRDGATGALTWQEVRRRERRQNSQAIVRGQAVIEEGTVLAFHLCKPGRKRKRLKYGQRHPECLLDAPYLWQPLQDPSLAGSLSMPAPICPPLQALESFAFLENKRHCCSRVTVSGIKVCCHAAGSASFHISKGLKPCQLQPRA